MDTGIHFFGYLEKHQTRHNSMGTWVMSKCEASFEQANQATSGETSFAQFDSKLGKWRCFLCFLRVAKANLGQNWPVCYRKLVPWLPLGMNGTISFRVFMQHLICYPALDVDGTMTVSFVCFWMDQNKTQIFPTFRCYQTHARKMKSMTIYL